MSFNDPCRILDIVPGSRCFKSGSLALSVLRMIEGASFDRVGQKGRDIIVPD